MMQFFLSQQESNSSHSPPLLSTVVCLVHYSFDWTWRFLENESWMKNRSRYLLVLNFYLLGSVGLLVVETFLLLLARETVTVSDGNHLPIGLFPAFGTPGRFPVFSFVNRSCFPLSPAPKAAELPDHACRSCRKNARRMNQGGDNSSPRHSRNSDLTLTWCCEKNGMGPSLVSACLSLFPPSPGLEVLQESGRTANRCVTILLRLRGPCSFFSSFPKMWWSSTFAKEFSSERIDPPLLHVDGIPPLPSTINTRSKCTKIGNRNEREHKKYKIGQPIS
jgi:hypothetical protein